MRLSEQVPRACPDHCGIWGETGAEDYANLAATRKYAKKIIGRNCMTFTPTRRRFIQTSSVALAGAAGLGAAEAKPLSFRYGYSAISWDTNIEEAIAVGQRVGLPGIEPFRHNVVNYLDKPLALKKIMSDHGLTMVTCSNGGGPDFSGNFYDPAKVKKTISDHVKFVREFIVPFGYCDHFKMNLGSRPPAYDTKDEHIKVCADALNQI